MVGSGTIKTLAVLIGAMTVGAGVLILMETDPARPSVSLPLQALRSSASGADLSVISDTEVPVQWIKWTNIVVHDSGREGRRAAEGCHFVIGSPEAGGDGTVQATVLWRRQGDGRHVYLPGYSYNENAIGICVLCDCRQAEPTGRQFAALTDLVQALQRTFRVPADHVYLHSDLGGAGCPGERFPAEMFRQSLLRLAP